MTLSIAEDADDTAVQFSPQSGVSLLSRVSAVVESCAVRS